MRCRRMLGLVLAVGVCAMFAGCSYGEKVEVGHVEVYYKPPVTNSEATTVANWFATGPFASPDRDGKFSFQLLRDGQVFQLKVVIRKGVELDDDTKASLKEWARGVSRALGGSKVEVHAADQTFHTKLIIFMD